MDSLKGHLLIASPQLSDPNFTRTVVLIAEHNDEGAFGVVLNRPGELRVGQILDSIPGEELSTSDEMEAQRSFVGGPVQGNSVILVHSFDDLAEGSIEVVPGVHIASELPILQQLLRRGVENSAIVSDRVRLFCGYSGWGAGQLEGEMEVGGWLTIPARSELVFGTPADRLWSAAIGEVGGPYRLFSLMPPHPDRN